MRDSRSRSMRMGFLVATAALVLTGACAGDDQLGPDATNNLEGALQLVMVGDGVNAHAEYFLETPARGDRWLRLGFTWHPEAFPAHAGTEGQHLVGGTTVRLHGTLVDADTLEVDWLTILQTPTETGLTKTVGALIAPTSQKVAVLLANFANNAAQPITPDAARSLVFTAASSANAYYQEQSFGIKSLTGIQRADGDVFGWYTIPANDNPCDYANWGTAARTAAKNAGVDLSGYSQVIHYFPRTTACAWSGVGQLPGRYNWINGSTSSTIAHELGHNFGVHHASSLTCTDASGARVPVSATCTSNEYGDPYDVMGRGYRHMNAYQKGRLGFLESANTQTATASGTFTVVPLERKATATQSLRVPIPATSPQLYYYVELRQRSTFDNFSSTDSVLSGVLIHRAPDYATLQRTQLLDLVPATTSFGDAALTVGRTFTDVAAGISIQVTSVSSSAATVVVTR